MMYNMYPLTMIPALKFSGLATNIGGNTQNQIQLFVEVKRNNSITTYSNNSSATNLSAGQTSLIQLNALYNTSAIEGEYVVYYNLDQVESDDNVSNNKDTLNYFITSHTYARDENDEFTKPPVGPIGFLLVAGLGCYLLFEALRAVVLREIPCVGKGCAGQVYTLAEHSGQYWANLFFVVWLVLALGYTMYVTIKIWTRG